MAIRHKLQATMGANNGGQGMGSEERVHETRTTNVVDCETKPGHVLEVVKKADEEVKTLHSVLIPQEKLKTPEEEALYNPSILEAIFSHLDLPSLLLARQVCKDWDDEAAKQISERGTIEIQIQPYSLNTPSELTEFTNLFQTSRALVISKFHLDRSRAAVFPHPLLNNFLSMFGPSMKQLTIPIFNLEDMQECLLKMGQLCLNLVSLEVECSNQDEIEWPRKDASVPGAELVTVKSVVVSGDMAVEQAKALFYATPNIATVEVLDSGGTVVEALVHCHRLSTVKDLRPDELWLPSDLERMGPLSLTRFEFLYPCRNFKGNFVTLLASFISSQGGTLRSLGLGFGHVNGSPLPDLIHLPLVKMVALTELSMYFSDGGFYTTSPDPDRDFPKLRRVKLLEVDATKDLVHRDPAPSVTELEVDLNVDGERDVNVKSPIWPISRMFPNVASLALEWPEVEDAALAFVAWPNLKHLDLRLFKESQYGLIKAKRLSLKAVTDQFPFVLNFPNLKSLSVWGRKVYESSG